ncbi:MAG: NUDIX domain-containing protein [Kiloniellales bacterium]|nr:NUDIX domain-containing protein [Kiloniellales bacterium]
MGYVGEGDKLRLWVATRSPFKPTGPGQRDALVGGGIAYGQDPFDTMIREAWEEAGFRPETVMGANPAGEVRFIYQGPQGIDQGLDYQFEVQLDEAVKPENQDGEVAGFELLPIRQVMAEVAAGSNFEPGYLYDARLAFIAFFLRHGYIAGDDPDYLAIKNALLGKLD